MIRVLRLLLKRLVILAIVLGLALFTVFELFPYIDNRLPSLAAVIATYLLLAYVIIPTVIRIFRIFDKPRHIPTCAMTGDGWQSDPVNVAIVARSKKDFIWAMKKAGWQTADEKTVVSVVRMIIAVAFRLPYPTAPFSNLYLFGRKQDIGFQMAVGNSPRKRHHIRFWRVTHASVLEEQPHEHLGFWRRLFKSVWRREQALWVGACLYDSGALGILWRNGQINHRNNPDADYEREFLIDTLMKGGVLKSVTHIKAGEPYRGRGQNLGLTIISDGYVRLCQLKRQILPPSAN